MKRVLLQLLQGMSPEVQRVLKGLEQEGELRPGFMVELVKELATERIVLARSMRDSVPARTPGTATPGDVRVAVNRAYYACHHGCRAALLVKFRLDYRGHRAVIEKMEKWAAADAAWKNAHPIIKDLIDRRHLADYDPYDAGSDGLLAPLPPPLPDQLIAELRAKAASVVGDVEAFLRSNGIIP